METAPILTNRDLLDKLRSLVVRNNPPPDDYFTTEEWCDKLGVETRTAARYLAAGVKARIMEKAMFNPRCGGKSVAHYRLIGGFGGTADARGCVKTSGKAG
jgi:hypothetical protein